MPTASILSGHHPSSATPWDSKLLWAIGMGICMCARHEHVLPLAAGDLQVGERYCNMDYITGSTTQTFNDTKEIFIYASLTKEMGPGTCHDMINDQFSSHNWRKETCLGHLLHEYQDCAVHQFNHQMSAHTIFTESLPQDKNWASEWTVMVEKWEVNDMAPNPYFKKVKSMAMGLLIKETQHLIRVDYKEMEENPLTRTQLKEQQDRQVTLQSAFMEGLTCKLEAGAAKYKVAWAALFALQGPGDWEEHLRVLQASDIETIDGAVFCIGLEEMEDDVSHYRKRKKDTKNTHEGEGYKTVSWIRETEEALGDGSNKQLHSSRPSSSEKPLLY
ncbi:hypothetical protein F5146DRAFT_1006956 [Armillaria mellea]|nr:hypothetical protein F5146DRAFT_1006956 [Armillaria mellea]